MKNASILERLAKNPARSLIPGLFGLVVGVFSGAGGNAWQHWTV
jgi:hypothetical protein